MGKGHKYAEGKAEKLKALPLGSLGHEEIVKVEPKSPKLGKELQVEVKELPSPPNLKLIVLNENGHHSV